MNYRHPLFPILLAVVWLLPANAHAAKPPANNHRPSPLIACDLVFPQAIQAGRHTVRIPFTWVGRLATVVARIDTVEGIFIFDTGAERLLLNERYFTGDSRLHGYTQQGITGAGKAVFRKQVDTLKWDNLYLPDVVANVLDLSHIEQVRNMRVVGIIGYEVFKGYEVLLDYPYRQIVLTKLDREGYRLDKDAFGEEPFDSLDFVLSNHGIVLKASVDGHPLMFNLDTGAEINLLDRKVPRKVLKQFKVLKRVDLMGTGSETLEVLAGTLAEVKCGAQRNGPMRTLLTNMDQLSEIMGTHIDGVLGFEYLRPRRTLINYTRRKVFFFKMTSP